MCISSHVWSQVIYQTLVVNWLKEDEEIVVLSARGGGQCDVPGLDFLRDDNDISFPPSCGRTDP